MLYDAPPCRGLLFQLLANKAFLESPDHYLLSEVYSRSFAHTHTEIWRREKCSTIRPLLGAQCLSF